MEALGGLSRPTEEVQQSVPAHQPVEVCQGAANIDLLLVQGRRRRSDQRQVLLLLPVLQFWNNAADVLNGVCEFRPHPGYPEQAELVLVLLPDEFDASLI